ncbi:MEKHLA domain-containing protein [Chitinibacter sp. FCG-7]|uniref:MEKHLA domain-containing protein n=1 Tax=Chitinibacter mangrovi TaxID=3153927 RepID=A0AAU7FEL8_9NEIS
MTQPELLQLIFDSHRRLLGRELAPSNFSPAQAATWLQHEAPFCVLAHEASADPRFIFANDTALRCFEYQASELIGLPSRLSAEAPNREERQQLLDAVSKQGYASGYRGLRIAKSGRRFWIKDVTVWNLLDAAGVCHGQAAVYAAWEDA